MELRTSLDNTAQPRRLIKWAGQQEELHQGWVQWVTGCILHAVFVQFPLPVVHRQKGRSVSQSSIQGKVCAPARLHSPAPLHGKKGKKRGNRSWTRGEGPMRRHRREQARLGRKSEESKQTNPRGRRSGREQELPRPQLGPGAIPHLCNESLPSLGGHVRALFWETEAGSAPVARRGRASSGRISQGRGLAETPLSRPGVGATRAEPQPRVVGLCQTKKQPHPQPDPPHPSHPKPCTGREWAARPNLGTQTSASPSPHGFGAHRGFPTAVPSSLLPTDTSVCLSLSVTLPRLLGKENNPCPGRAGHLSPPCPPGTPLPSLLRLLQYRTPAMPRTWLRTKAAGGR